MSRRRLRLPLLAAIAALIASPAWAETIKVGVTAGPHAEILEQVAKVAAKDGLEIKIVEFNDYVLPNTALAQKDLDANSFQHQPYLDNQVRDRGFALTSIAKTVVFPMGIYSKKVKSLAELPAGARVTIPNDPTNGGRALLLLEKLGLLKLKPDAGLKATPLDVVDNPKGLKIKEIDAAQLPRTLDDTEIAVINTNYAMPAGLLPHRDALGIESVDSPYANVIAVRTEDKDKPVFAKLVKAYHDPEVRKFIADKYGASVVPAF